jgi:hypothetical protein
MRESEQNASFEHSKIEDFNPNKIAQQAKSDKNRTEIM